MPDKKIPLRKQLLGALAGAAVAFVLYKGVTLVSGGFQALVTLPTAPGVVQNRIRSASKEKLPRLDRIQRRTEEAARRLGKGTTNNVSQNSLKPVSRRTSPPYVVYTESSVSSDSTHPLRPTGTLTSPSDDALSRIAAATSSSMSKAVSSSSASISSASSVSSSVPGGEIQAPLPSSVSSRASMEAIMPVKGEGPHPIWPTSTLSFPNEVIKPHYASPVAHAGALPQSGFGIETLVVVTIGAIVGRKRMLRKSILSFLF